MVARNSRCRPACSADAHSPSARPPQIVFNPDGQTFDIAVDKLREDQLAAAAEAAAAERRREQQRAAAAALGPAGARPAGGSRAEQLDPDVAVWRAAYARQKVRWDSHDSLKPRTACMRPPTEGSTASDACCVLMPTLLADACFPAGPSLPQLLVLLTLAIDVVYLIVLLVLRLAWGGSNGEGSAPDRELCKRRATCRRHAVRGVNCLRGCSH